MTARKFLANRRAKKARWRQNYVLDGLRRDLLSLGADISTERWGARSVRVTARLGGWETTALILGSGEILWGSWNPGVFNEEKP